MKDSKIMLVVIGIAVIAGVGFIVFSNNANKPVVEINTADSTMQKDSGQKIVNPEGAQTNEVMTKNEGNTVMAKPENTTMEKNISASRYSEYSASTLETSRNSRRVLFFYASWCPTCRPADSSFTTNVDKIPEDVTVIRVNYNDTETDQEEKELAKKYGVTYQHTFVQIDKDGMEINKWNGGQLEELISKIK